MGWFSKKKKSDESNLKSYTFIWYKRMVNNNTTHYTKPFRTTVKAKSYEEAKEKVTNFALRKMELIVADEKGFKKSDLNKLNKEFDKIGDIFKEMENTFGKHK